MFADDGLVTAVHGILIAVPELIDAGVVTVYVAVLVATLPVPALNPVTVPRLVPNVKPAGAEHAPEAVVQYRKSTVDIVAVVAVVNAKV